MQGYTKRPLLLIAWKNLKTYPVRILLTTSSVILGVAVIIAIGATTGFYYTGKEKKKNKNK